MVNKMKKAAAICMVFCGLLTGCGTGRAVVDESNGTLSVDKTETEVTEVSEEGEVDMTEETKMTDVSENTQQLTTEEAGETTLTYIGHATVKIVAKDGTVIYIDPAFENGDYTEEADYVFVTHDHYDHVPSKDVVLKPDGKTVTHVEALHDGIYETFDYGNVKLEAVAASNANHNINECVGYIVTVDGITIYHAGDTSMVDQMKELAGKKIDYALYPIDGVYNMDAKEATEVATLVGAKNNIPIHELDEGSAKKSDNFTPDGKMVIAYGETIVLK